jgi:hypothetical protein
MKLGIALAHVTHRRMAGETLESIADEIVAISNALKVLRTTRRTEDTLILLIREGAVTTRASTGRTNKVALSAKQVKAVLDAITHMEEQCLKPKEKK